MNEPRLVGCEISGGASVDEAAAIVAAIHDVLTNEAVPNRDADDVRLTSWIRSGIRRPLAGPPEGW